MCTPTYYKRTHGKSPFLARETQSFFRAFITTLIDLIKVDNRILSTAYLSLRPWASTKLLQRMRIKSIKSQMATKAIRPKPTTMPAVSQPSTVQISITAPDPALLP